VAELGEESARGVAQAHVGRIAERVLDRTLETFERIRRPAREAQVST